YAAPALILLIAAGVPATFDWLHERCSPARFVLAALLLAPLGLTAYRAVIPWGRAACAAAAEYILAHRQPTEAIAGNHWEYQYYFRNVGRWYLSLENGPPPLPSRLWLVLSGWTPEEQSRFVHILPPGDWETIDRREFERTTVWLLQRPLEQTA